MGEGVHASPYFKIVCVMFMKLFPGVSYFLRNFWKQNYSKKLASVYAWMSLWNFCAPQPPHHHHDLSTGAYLKTKSHIYDETFLRK